MTPEEDGTRMRLCIVEALENLECSINQDNNVIRFRAENDDGTYEQIKQSTKFLTKLKKKMDMIKDASLYQLMQIKAPSNVLTLITRDAMGCLCIMGKLGDHI